MKTTSLSRSSDFSPHSVAAAARHTVFQSRKSYHWHAAALIAVLTLGTATSHALQVNLTANAPGSLIYGQTFNETRGIDLTVLAASDLAVSSMKLEGLSIGQAQSAAVGARIYDSSTHNLVAIYQ